MSGVREPSAGSESAYRRHSRAAIVRTESVSFSQKSGESDKENKQRDSIYYHNLPVCYLIPIQFF